MEKESDMNDETERQAGDPAEPTISFEIWAEVAAEMLERTSAERLEILERRSVKPEDWTPSDGYWTERMTEAIAEGDFTRADVYAKRCAEVFQARRSAAMAGSGEAPPAPEAAVGPVVPVMPVVPVAPEVPAMPVVPVMPVAPVAPIVPVMPVAPIAPIAPIMPVAPILQPPAAVAPPLQPPAAIMAPLQSEGASPANPAQGSDPLAGTVLGVESPWVAALPFAPKVADQIALAGAAKHASEVQPSGPARRAPKMGETAMIPAMNELFMKTLPFDDSDGAPAAAPPEISRPSDAPAPPESATLAGLPEFTVERFASLCAELELDASRSAEILDRYRIRADQKAILDKAWGARFRAEPATYAAFQEAKSIYTRWLFAQKGGPV
jgi:hypothetical protein